jgi:uncharacterized membrane protein YebE (DUF533 family)
MTEASALRRLIQRAIDDGRITSSEYDGIKAQIEKDGLVDDEEVRLMRELQLKLADGTVVRV